MGSEKGQVLIELALGLLLLLVILFGITEFGRYFFQRNTLNNAARAGVRQAVVTPDLDAENNSGPITDYVNSTLPSGATATVCVCIDLALGESCITTTVPPTCTGAGAGSATNGDGDRITVSVGNTFTIVSGTIFPFLGGDPTVIVGDASMRYEL